LDLSDEKELDLDEIERNRPVVEYDNDDEKSEDEMI